ncbi:MAG: DoxX family protein [Nanoarchaeota archaeon]
MLNKLQGPALLRIALGILFLVPGLAKLMDPGMITGMLSGLGFPVAPLFAWILILVEIICGALLIIGFKTEIAIWPLFVVLLVALLLVAIPSFDASKVDTIMALLWHLVGLAGLLSINSTGPGKLF